MQQWGPSNSNRAAEREAVVRSGKCILLIGYAQDLRYLVPVHLGPNGYPKLARFLDSDDNFMVYRRFGFLQTRLLLEKQDTLRVLEKRLDRLDESETIGDDNEDNLCSRDGDGGDQTERINLMTAIRTAFQEYGQFAPSQPWSP